MDSLPIYAKIDHDGTFYEIKLHAVPHVGDLINLYSYVEQKAGKDATFHYKVTKVLHRLRDHTDETPRGMHEVVVFVAPTDDPAFNAYS